MKKELVLLFGGEFCSPCERIKMNLVKYEIDFKYIDVEECESLVRKYDIKSVPTLIKDGREIELEELIGGEKCRTKNAIEKKN